MIEWKKNSFHEKIQFALNSKLVKTDTVAMNQY